MTPTLIVLGLLALGVGIVAWATRRKPGQPRVARHEQDVVWNDPITPASTVATIPTVVADNPFAHAPAGVEAPAEEARP